MTTEAPSHPLDDASAAELERAVAILRDSGNLSDRAFFACGHRVEPSPAALADGNVARVIRLIGHDPEAGKSFDAHVSLTGGSVASFGHAEQGQAPITGQDVADVYGVLFEDEAYVAALAKRGIEDLSLVHIEPWLAGVHPPEMPTGRVWRAIAFLHQDPDDNYYAYPIEGLVAFVDTDNGTAIVEDHGVVPIPSESGDYAADRVEHRTDLKALEITQPDGPSFEVEGRVIRWQRWEMRISVHPIEGLVLHDIGYRDGDRLRPILRRAALSDMVVPYGDSSPLHYWKHAFDAAETSLGSSANSLTLGCDCLGEIYYFDAEFLGNDGQARTQENTVCLHEEDFGILWKHTNPFHPDLPVEVRRSRRLVVSTIHTIGNYEYGFYWYFYLDGTIQLEMKLTGIIGVSAAGPEGGTDTSPLVGPSVTSPIHQHLFCFRLDFSVDGPNNTVVETNVEATTDGAHPYGAGFRSVGTVLASEQQAMRDINPASSRSWRIVNPSSNNGLGEPVSYKLLPGSSPQFMVPEDTVAGRRGGFARHNLWVTPYDEDELYCGAGPFTNLHPGGEGLATYVKADRPVEDQPIVVWHTFGVTHVPRPEDWPIMPVEYAGFTLLPYGFFDQNPSLDVAPSTACH